MDIDTYQVFCGDKEYWYQRKALDPGKIIDELKHELAGSGITPFYPGLEEAKQILMEMMANATDAILDSYANSHDNYGVMEVSVSKSSICGQDHLLFEIKDNGSPIPEPVKRRLFLEDIVSPKGKDKIRHIGGLGKGLSDSGKYLRKAGGTYGFEENCDKKSFYFSIPADALNIKHYIKR